MTNRQLFLNYLAQTSDTPLSLEIERASGVYMYEPGGKRYMDLISGISVSNLGHSHPRVVKAVKDQAEKYMHLMVYGEYIQSPQVQLAEALAETLPPTLGSVYLVNSGSEAIEGALKLAKKYTGRSGLIAATNAYHGSTHGALSMGSDEELKKGYGPFLPNVNHIEYGSEQDLEKITDQTACVLLETVQGEAGIVSAPNQYWQMVRQKCNETGALLIMDEIQTGFGRTGNFWGFEAYDIVPDILVSAKGMGSGMPIGAFISSSEIMSVISRDPILGHITTFGGHPVSAAASLEGLRVLQEERLVEQVEEKGKVFESELQDLPGLVSFRRNGLMMALEFDSYETLKPIIDRGIEEGVITDWFLFNNKSMRIAPPLIISMEEIHEACRIIRNAVIS